MTDPDPMRLPSPESAKSDATAAYQASDAASELVKVLDRYLADLQAGCAPERAKLLAEHSSLAPQSEQCLAGIEFIHRATGPGPEAAAQLGDFRIIREVGRGGIVANNWASALRTKRLPRTRPGPKVRPILARPKATSAQKYIKIAQGLCPLQRGVIES